MIPPEFIERLRLIVPGEDIEGVMSGFSLQDALTIRVNPLKTATLDLLSPFREMGAELEPVDWCPSAFIISGLAHAEISHHPLAGQGKIYQQSLSSLIPAIILDPRPGESVLDACAAPGSKTAQMSAMMKNEGVIVAVEAVRSRFFRLKAVCELMGAGNVTSKLCDIRRFRSPEGMMFERVLVDAPCSSEGRFKEQDPDSVSYWSLRKIKEMSYKQKGILMSASRHLKPAGTLVYSTCTFAPEENEEVVDWFLRKSEGLFTLEDIALAGVPAYPCVTHWGRAVFDPQVRKCLRVKPVRGYSGFFVAKFRRKH